VPNFEEFTVTGVFETGMYEYDNTYLYVDLPLAQRLAGLGEAVTAIEVRTVDRWRAADIARSLADRLGFPYFTRDWQEQNSSLFQALKLEKLGMSVILLLIVVVAAFNIVSTLTMVVTDKTREIGILKAMGLPARSVLRVFFMQGLVIGIVGTGLGLVLGGVGAWRSSATSSSASTRRCTSSTTSRWRPSRATCSSRRWRASRSPRWPRSTPRSKPRSSTPSRPSAMSDAAAPGRGPAAVVSVVEARGVTKEYRGGDGSLLRVLDEVALQVRRGEMVAVVGASGSGKSTLLHVLGALERPTRGEVWIGGEHSAVATTKNSPGCGTARLGSVSIPPPLARVSALET
jgi:ABC-type multidrug transport system fused ATPase/permease subunit